MAGRAHVCAPILVLALEVIEYAGVGSIRIHPAGIVVVAVVLVAMCATTLAFALLPGRDPLEANNKGIWTSMPPSPSSRWCSSICG